ncbi:MAG: N,N-dimethylformamidase beta subunit family domain-containing protein, partial [Terracidiphilus sp.]
MVFLQLLLLLVSARCLATQTNSIVIENALPGTPSSQWDISGAGDTSIQGYATDISVSQGGTIYFKINTPASAYRIDIYRLGYYQGNGARYITTVMPSAHLPQSQPAPITDPSTGLIDYGNWAVSASWQVPTNATSGLYIARLVRTDTGGASHIAFVVRNDSSTSDIYYKTSDTTWQAYNDYGGNSLYVGTGPGAGLAAVGRAYKVSYNRPFNTRGDSSQDWLFNAEYPMIRWLEENGYDVSYTTSVDADRRGNLLLQHKLLLSVGHDEYWSGNERTNVETARTAGVNLAFFSGNEVFWKTRWETSIDGSNTPYRTLVCYKETHVDAKIDPTPTWTGTWRDPRFSPPSDGGRPENALTGTIFISNTGITSNSIEIPAAFGKLRFWRNTTLATAPSGSTVAFPAGMLGYEWDQDSDNGFRAPATIDLWSSTFGGVQTLQDFGSVYAYGVATHNLTLYRGSGGGLVFGAGTVQWSWGLDSNHDNGSAAPSPDIQQANINLFADMGVQPQTLQAGLVAATASSDHTPPTSTILTPTSGANVGYASPVVVSGTASDTGGGRVAGVEVSTDGGATWHPASGLTNWTYSWIPLQGGPATIQVRAIDDSCNIQSPAAAVSVTVVSTPLTVWPSSAVPTIIDQGADNPLEVGVKFRSDVAGFITGIRFYKCAINVGTHIGDLWTSNGTHLASAPFTVETPSGWQQVNFTNPVPISSNTFYVASYHANNGHYSEDDYYFASNGVDNVPLHLLADGVSGPNGVYSYGANSVFPTSTWEAANYWVDVAFGTTNALQTLVSIAVSPTNTTLITGGFQQFTATGTYSNSSTHVTSTQDITSQVTWTSTNTAVATVNAAGLVTAVSPGVTAISATMNSVTGSTLLTIQTGPLSITTTSLAGDFVNTAYAATLSASGGTMPYTWSIISGSLPNGLTLNTNTGAITGTPTTAGTFNFTAQVSDASLPVHTATQPLSITITSLPNTVTIWPSSAVPTVIDQGTDSPVELGVKFRSDIGGFVTSIRFYKASANAGTHIGDLWTTNGTLLATATFTGETASGWQQVNFASPVSINSNTVYVASYHCNNGHYSADDNYFASSGVDNPPLHALANGVSGPDGVYAYSAGSAFPTNGFNADNYWVDAVFASNLAPVLPAQTNRVINELTTLTVTNTATDTSALSYTLAVTNVVTGQMVTNASINTNGVITWTPTEAQGPSTNTFTTIVSDGSLSATNSFTVTVNEVNTAPTLPVQSNRTLVGTQSLTVTNTASDSDIPINPLGYVLTGPTGSTIDTNGVIRWTPTVGQVPGVYTFTTVVTDTNVYAVNAQDLSATNSFTVTVQAIHNGPVLGVVSNQVMNELTLLTVTNAATDNDIPALPLSYTLTVTNALTGSAVTNASINTNGVITWTPTEVQGPSTNTFTT